VTCSQVNTDSTILRIFERSLSYNFEEVNFIHEIEKDSQPFITDLNGDFIEDILFNDVNKTMQVAYQTQDGKSFVVMPFT
jgi:hypothetical protein